jgi:hypothetical protein
MVYFLNHKKIVFKFFALIPIALSILSFVAKGIEASSYSMHESLWFPKFLRFQYDWLSIGIMLGCYLSYSITNKYFSYQSNFTGLQLDQVKGTSMYRLGVNLVACFSIVLFNCIYYLFKFFAPSFVFWDLGTQMFAMCAGLLVLTYNEKRGYDSKWFRVFTYSYYPLHIIVIYAIIYLINMI